MPRLRGGARSARRGYDLRGEQSADGGPYLRNGFHPSRRMGYDFVGLACLCLWQKPAIRSATAIPMKRTPTPLRMSKGSMLGSSWPSTGPTVGATSAPDQCSLRPNPEGRLLQALGGKTGDRNIPMRAEVSLGARRGPALGAARARDPGVPAPPIEEDVDPLLLLVEGGQSLDQLRLITRDNDETARHVAGPPRCGREAGNAPATFKLATIRQFVKRGKEKMNPPTNPSPSASWPCRARRGARDPRAGVRG